MGGCRAGDVSAGWQLLEIPASEQTRDFEGFWSSISATCVLAGFWVAICPTRRRVLPRTSLMIKRSNAAPMVCRIRLGASLGDLRLSFTIASRSATSTRATETA